MLDSCWVSWVCDETSLYQALMYIGYILSDNIMFNFAGVVVCSSFSPFDNDIQDSCLILTTETT